MNEGEVYSAGGGILTLLFFAWWILYVVQGFFAFGTAYRYTKMGGDNGVALFGWFFAFSLAAAIPGLGIYLWHKSKDFA